MAKTELTTSQLHSIEITERVCSILSLLGTTFIIITFLSHRAFYKPINRLVFYAAIGNVLANVGTLIAQSGIRMGGGLCQFQGFLIQMFLPADALWTLAMACNVYLTFFHKYDARALRALEWKYLLICYGGPFIPAFVYFFIKTKEHGRVYGNATLWCWVDISWDYLRIAMFYGPVWLIILITFGIYIVAGKEIFEKRKALRNFTGSQDAPYPMLENPFLSTVTREVRITSEPAHPIDDSSQSSLKREVNVPGKDRRLKYDPYSVTIETGPEQDTFTPTTTNAAADKPSRSRPQYNVAMEANKAAFGYARVSLLFFAAIIVTWVPSTVNRVNSLVRPDQVSFGLNYVSALVLPLQGFWNSIIYIITSRQACQELWTDLRQSMFPDRRRSASMDRSKSIRKYASRPGQEELTDSDSTKGFART